ncbi:VOC family protein [Streptomyces sp. NPDC001941]|uniref:VOC family protein n=1 Tax=Streptomyces sp. NPDC001941 TaxID=3154659 RepID=UPI00332EDE11
MATAKTTVVVLDCSEPKVLARFYAELLDGEVKASVDSDYMDVIGHDGTRLSIYHDRGYAPPSWPRPDDSQQVHLRLYVAPEDMDEAEREVIGLGATPIDTKDNGGPHDTRLYADPAGHTFTLVAMEEM